MNSTKTTNSIVLTYHGKASHVMGRLTALCTLYGNIKMVDVIKYEGESRN